MRAGGNALLAVAAASLAIAGAELLLRATLPARDRYYVNTPGSDQVAHISPDVVRGVDSVVHYRVNALGIRGRAFGADAVEYRVLAVGGSTTECLLLNDDDAWPSLVERMAPRTADGRRLWVGSVGRSAMTARENVLHLKYLLPQYPRIDVVVALVGVNDMLSALRRGDGYREPRPITEPAAERDDLRRAFVALPRMEQLPVDGVHYPWYHRMAIWDLARRARAAWRARESFDITAEGGLVAARRRRAATRKLDSLPSLAAPLDEFRRNLDAMADIAASRKVRLVFMTQPAAWSDAIPDSVQRTFWLGWRGGSWMDADAWYSPAALAQAMDAFNAVTLERCAARHVECVDAARALAHDPAMFYDDVHFTIAGSRAVAGLLARHLVAEVGGHKTNSGIGSRSSGVGSGIPKRASVGRIRPPSSATDVRYPSSLMLENPMRTQERIRGKSVYGGMMPRLMLALALLALPGAARAQDAAGDSTKTIREYRGTYQRGFEQSWFSPCGAPRDDNMWWVTLTDDALRQRDSLLAKITAPATSGLAVRWKGTVGAKMPAGMMGRGTRYILVTSIEEIWPLPSEGACSTAVRT